MTTQTAEPMTIETIRLLYRRISVLPNESMRKLYNYVEELIEEEEEEEDIAYIKAHKDDGPTVPWHEVVAEFEAEHGPLY